MYKPYVFRFKQFSIWQGGASYKVGTDSILLGSWTRLEGVKRAVDLGTGSGILALMMAQREPGLIIDAIEVDPEVIAETRRNVHSSPWSDRIRIVESDAMDPLVYASKKYDLVIANAPYFFAGQRSPKVFREKARHGIGFQVLDLPRISSAIIAENGRLSVVLPPTITDDFVSIANDNKWYVSRRLNVRITGRKSSSLILLECTKSIVKPCHEELVMAANGKPSAAYYRLCGEFVEAPGVDQKATIKKREV